VIEVNCRSAVSASVRTAFKATSTDGLRQESFVTTEVFANALAVKMTGPETAAVGSEAKFLIDVTNTGQATLTNLVASDTFGAGLAERGGANSPAVRAIAEPLEPGQTHSFALTFVVTEAGRLSHRLDVSADGGHRGSARAFVIGTQPVIAARPAAPASQPAPSAGGSAPPLLTALPSGNLKVTASLASTSLRQGATTTCDIRVVNDRTVSDQDVTIAVELTGEGVALSSTPVKSSPTPTVRAGAGGLEFAPLRELRAGERLQPYRIEVHGLQPGRYKIRATVTSSRSPAPVAAEAELTVVGPS
jgi:uncharacterized repeat protein (TIGR01451 family)